MLLNPRGGESGGDVGGDAGDGAGGEPGGEPGGESGGEPGGGAEQTPLAVAAALVRVQHAAVALKHSLPATAASLDALLGRRTFDVERARALEPGFDDVVDEPPAPLLTLGGHVRCVPVGTHVPHQPSTPAFRG